MSRELEKVEREIQRLKGILNDKTHAASGDTRYSGKVLQRLTELYKERNRLTPP